MAPDISRQAFLRGGLGTLAGVLLGSCGEAPKQPSSSGSPDWGALADSIQGQVTLPSSADYAGAKNLFNSRYDNSTPAAVVTVQSTGDVQQAIAFAANNGVQVAARSGGHSYIGASAANGVMVIDLRQLPGGTAYDDESGLATIPAAADLDSVQTTLAAQGRLIPSGSCPTVGVAGLTLGGGLGSDARQWGLTCDALMSASVVLPSGDPITATPDDYADLYWALRGGGGGNFGVVTSFTLSTFPTTDRDVVTLVFPAGSAEQVILGWNQWLSTADRAVWGMVNITAGQASPGCSVTLATPPGDGPGRAGDIIAAIGVQATSNTTQTLSRMDFVHYFEGGDQAWYPRVFVAGSDIVGQMTSSAAQAIVAATTAWPQDAGSASAVIESLSGAVSDVDPGGTAFPWRQQAASIQWYSEPSPPNPVDVGDAWLVAAHQAMGANSVGGYVNYVEPGSTASRYFGANLPRLNAVRQQYDPSGLMYSGIQPV
jgi:FAD/FMN-containing dehydrogenase